MTKFYVTYPMGSNLRKRYSVIEADSNYDARLLCHDTLGKTGWSFVYSGEDFADQIDEYGLTEVPFGTIAVMR